MDVVIKLSFLTLLFLMRLEWSKLQPTQSQWKYPEKPNILRDKLLKLRKDVDEYLSLPYQSPCSNTSSISVAYMTLLHQMLLDMLNYDIDGFRDNPERVKNHSRMLEEEVEKAKKGGGTPAICALTKGMICSSSGKCECREQYKAYNGDFKLRLSYDAATGSCFLDENSPCQAEWEPRCVSPLECTATSDVNDTLLDLPDKKNPELDMLCTHRNRSKYRLDSGGWMTSDPSLTGCFCTPPTSHRREILKKTVDQLTETLTYGENCTADGYSLERLLLKRVPLLLAKPKWNRKDISSYREFIRYAEINKVQPIVCQRKTQRLACGNNTKCDCDDPGHFDPDIKIYEGAWDPVNKECYTLSEGRCGYQDFFPKCQEHLGFLCLIDNLRVLCEESNFKMLGRYETDWFKDRLIGCKCRDKTGIKVASRITTNLELTTIRKNVDTQKSKNVKDTLKILKSDNQTVIRNLGESCVWGYDRRYFNAMDHIRGNMESIFYEVEDYAKLIRLRKDEVSNLSFDICDHENQGLRCDFVQQTCQCPTDQFELEKIPSFYNTTRKRCELRSGSRCHPTLSEWLLCPEGESCVYKENKALCNRVNMRKIVESKNFLKKAKCICLSNDQVKKFSFNNGNNEKEQQVEL